LGVGSYKPRERRYIVEWAEKRFPDCEKRFNVPLGPIPEGIVQEFGPLKAARIYRPWRPDVDAIIICPGKIILAEAEIKNPRSAIGDLVVYRDLLPKTPELKRYLDRPIEVWMVIPWVTTWVRETAAEKGINIDIFIPDWLQEYVEELHKYYTKEGRLKREQRRSALEGLGL